jgi:hypothetical protein
MRYKKRQRAFPRWFGVSVEWNRFNAPLVEESLAPFAHLVNGLAINHRIVSNGIPQVARWRLYVAPDVAAPLCVWHGLHFKNRPNYVKIFLRND